MQRPTQYDISTYSGIYNVANACFRWYRENGRLRHQLGDVTGIIVERNDRFTRRLADASVRKGVGFLRFSGPLWRRASDQERWETIVHEVAHIVQRAWEVDGQVRTPSHGRLWKSIHREFGIEPERCHRVDRTGLRRKARRYVYRCNCRDEIELGPGRHAKIQKGTAWYQCRNCRKRLEFTGEERLPRSF